MIDFRRIPTWLREVRGLAVYQYQARDDLLLALREDPGFLLAYYQWLFLVYCTRGPTTPEFVRLGDLHHAHPIHWEAYFAKVRARAERLQQLDVGDSIDMATLNEVMPSSVNMLVGHDPASGIYIVMEGNGRLEALRTAFPGQLDLRIEVDVFQLTERHIRVMHRLGKQMQDSHGHRRLARIHGGLDPQRADPRPARNALPVQHVGDLLDDPGFRKDPYPLSAELRQRAPVLQLHQGVWLLSSHHAVRTVLSDGRFSSDLSLATARPPDPDDGATQLVAQLVLVVDPPEHTDMRHILNHGFTPRAVRNHRAQVGPIVDRLIDTVADTGEMDFVADFAQPLPLAVICDLFDIPLADRQRMHGWSTVLSAMLDPLLAFDPERRQRANEAMAEYSEYMQHLIEKRRETPGSDILSTLANLEAGGHRLSDSQLVANALGIILAGHETLTATLAHSLVAFHHDPDQWERLAAEPSLLASAALECMRYACPFTFVFRSVPEPIDALGHSFGAGDVVGLLLPAANRDPAAFDDPDTFDVTRNPTEHLAQGAGAHLCLGVHLAPAELEIALGALTQRLRNVRLAEDPADLPRGPAVGLRSYKAMPITFEVR